jgi:hypothetical protein
MDGRDSGAGEVLRTVGLLLNFAAIIAFALFLSTLGSAASGRSYVAAAITVATFIASLLCLAADPQRDEDRLDVADQPAVP